MEQSTITPTTPDAPTATAPASTATPPPDYLYLPAPTGPYAVGRTLYFLTDTSRLEIHTTADPFDLRDLMVEIWYPAEPVAEAASSFYLAPVLAEAWGFPAEINQYLSHAIVGAPLANDRDEYPVLIFNPGFSATPIDYTFLTEELASYGYVVLGLSHPYTTAGTVLPNGQLAFYPGTTAFNQVWQPLDPYASELSEVWVPDTLFIMDELTTLNTGAPGEPFTGRLQLDQIGLFGHSFGGRTAAEICLLDERCAAAVNFDGGHTPAVLNAGLNIPYMNFAASDSGEEYQTERQTLFDLAPEHVVLLEVEGTTHYSFGDGCYIAALFEMPDLAERYGTVDCERMLTIVRAYTLALFNYAMHGEESVLLEGAVQDYPEVIFGPSD